MANDKSIQETPKNRKHELCAGEVLQNHLSLADISGVFILNLFCLGLILTTGCATLSNGQGWGQNAWSIDGERIINAAHNAFFNPNTLIPLIGAGIFYAIDNFDERTSHWATKHHPVFGSSAGARDVGRSFKTALKFETYITSLATPSGNDPQGWICSKLKGIGVELVAWNAVKGTTSILKHETNRVRPNGANDLSFPSRCTSFAFSSATLSNRNLNYIDEDALWMSNGLRRGLQFGNFCLASGVAWARVERGAHYPSDVLAGAALGHFLSAFIYDAFLGLPENERVSFSVVPFEGGAMAQLSFNF